MRPSGSLWLAVLLATGCQTVVPIKETAPNEWMPTYSEPIAPSSAASPRQVAKGSVESRLRQLQTLRDQGLITDSELKERRREILKDL